MTRNASARIAGFTYLFYIAVAFPAMVLVDKATAGEGMPARLASVAQHTTEMRVSIVLGLLSVFSALVLAVTLYGVTRDEDHELAMFGLVCRVGEGVAGSIPVTTAGLLWLATTTGPNAPDPAGANAIGAFLLRTGAWQTSTSATLFAVGSTAFCSLLLRGRMIPVPLAWLGVFGSALVAVGVPMALTGTLSGPAAQLQWIPIALFELTVAVWFLIKGVPPLRRQSA